MDERESEDGKGNAPSPTSSSSAPCTSPTTTAAPSALFSDERLARLEAFQIASEVLDIRMKQREAALAQGGMLPR